MSLMIYSILITIVCIYLSIRVYKLRTSLKKILGHLGEIEKKIPVLTPMDSERKG